MSKSPLDAYLNTRENPFSPYIKKWNLFKRPPHSFSLQSINQQIMAHHKTDPWPFWVYKKITPDPKDIKNKPLLENTKHRNWTALNHPFHPSCVLIDPKGMLSIGPTGWSLDLWIHDQTGLHPISKSDNNLQTMHDNGTRLCTTILAKHLSCQISCSFLNKDTVLYTLHFKNIGQTPYKGSSIVAIRPYNPLGLTPIKTISYHSHQAFMINHTLALQLDTLPNNIICSRYNDGPIEHYLNKWDMIYHAQCPDLLASGLASYTLNLAAQESYTLNIKIPLSEKPRLHFFSLSTRKKEALISRIKILRKTSVPHSTNKGTHPSLTILFPDNKKQALLRLSIGHLSQSPIPERNFALSFQLVLSALECNLFSRAKYILRTSLFNIYASRLSGHPLWVYNFALIALDYYVKFSKDSALLIKVQAPIQYCALKIKRSAQALLKKYSKKSPAVKNELLLQFIYTTAGTRSFCKLHRLGTLMKTAPLLELETPLNTLLTTLHVNLKESHFIRNTLRDTHPPYALPLLAIYPFFLFNSYETNIINLLIQQVVKKTPASCTLQAMQLAYCYAVQKNRDLLPHLTRLTDAALTTGAWPAYIDTESKGGIRGTGHSLWANCLYVSTLRKLFISEEENNLVLTPYTPESWYFDSKTPCLRFKGPSLFGPLFFSLKKQGQSITLQITHTFLNPPKKISICFPFMIESLSINNHELSVHNHTATLPIDASEILFKCL